MQTDLLSAQTEMGAVTLRAADMDAMIRYYTEGVLLQVFSNSGDRVVMGRGTTPIVILEHAPELKHAPRGSAGLFHTAVLYETKADLAAAVYSVATKYPELWTGSADHLVSQAFYANDPEGNGIELYWDRDRTEWSWTHGMVEMDTIYLDPRKFIEENLTAEALSSALTRPGKVGHVHLSVGDVESAREFYVNRLGFETTTSLGNQALFVSAGGYHHHMAMNVWNSRGAGLRAPALGLGLVRIEVPTADEVGALTDRMTHFGVKSTDDGRTVSFDDPWANRIEVTAADA
jgi:catechol 2,3-dioxygenase